MKSHYPLVILSLLGLSYFGGRAQSSNNNSIESAPIVESPFEKYWLVGKVRDLSGPLDPSINLYKNKVLVQHIGAPGGFFGLALTNWQSRDFTHILFATGGHFKVLIPRDSMDFSNDTVFFDVFLKRLPPEMDTINKVTITPEVYYRAAPDKK